MLFDCGVKNLFFVLGRGTVMKNNEMTRREMLKGAVAAAAAVVPPS